MRPAAGAVHCAPIIRDERRRQIRSDVPAASPDAFEQADSDSVNMVLIVAILAAGLPSSWTAPQIESLGPRTPTTKPAETHSRLVLTLSVDEAAGLPVRIRSNRRDETLLVPDRGLIEASTGETITASAPTIHDGRVFSHWCINGDVQLDRQPTLTLEVLADTALSPRYVQLDQNAAPANVFVGAYPGGAADLSISFNDDDGSCVVPPAGVWIQMSTGERVRVRAPLHTDSAALEGWRLNGRALTGPQATLDLWIAGGSTLQADYVVSGDLNDDERVNAEDVSAFTLALSNPALFAQRYPRVDPLARGDLNRDGALGTDDIEPFVELLLRHGDRAASP